MFHLKLIHKYSGAGCILQASFQRNPGEIYQGLYEEQSCIMKVGILGKSKAGKRAVPPFSDTKWIPAIMRNFLSHKSTDEHF